MKTHGSCHWLAILAALSLALTPALAKPPKDKPGGGGGDDGGTSAEYDLVLLMPRGFQVDKSWVTDLDEWGNVIGAFTSAGDVRSFHFDPLTETWLTSAVDIRLLGCNNFGHLVGGDFVSGEALWWSSPNDAAPVTLPPLLDYTFAFAVDVNDAGVVIGESYAATGDRSITVWIVDGGGVSAPMPLPAGTAFSRVYALNEADQSNVVQIVGASGTGSPGDTALLWEVGIVDGEPVLLSGPTDLGSLDGGETVAYGINNSGDIVGESGNWPFLKYAGAPMLPLDGIPKATFGVASDVNDDGVIVGEQYYIARGRIIVKAVLWDAAGNASELGRSVTLGRDDQLEGANHINAAGWITGSGYFPDISQNDNIGFLLKVVP